MLERRGGKQEGGIGGITQLDKQSCWFWCSQDLLFSTRVTEMYKTMSDTQQINRKSLFSIVFGEKIRKEQPMMFTGNVFRRKCINQSSWPAKDSKRQIIMLKVLQVSLIPNDS